MLIIEKIKKINKILILKYAVLLLIVIAIITFALLIGVHIPNAYDNPEYVSSGVYNTVSTIILIIGITILILLIISYFIGNKLTKNKESDQDTNEYDS